MSRTLWLGEITYSTLFDICDIPSVPKTLRTSDRVAGLVRPPTSLPRFCTAAVWVSPIAFETVTFIMAIYKIWSHARESGNLSSNPMLRVLYRDGVLYFVVGPCFIQPAYPQTNELSHSGYNGCVSTILGWHFRPDGRLAPQVFACSTSSAV